MSIGKTFCLIGGILTLISTYLLSFVYIPSNGFASYGIGFILSLGTDFNYLFSIVFLFNEGKIVISLIAATSIIVLVSILILFLTSGLFLLLGIKYRKLAYIGSIMPVFISLTFICIFVSGETFYFPYYLLRASIINGILPLHVNVGNFDTWEISLGTYVLLIGGIIGLIGGIKYIH